MKRDEILKRHETLEDKISSLLGPNKNLLGELLELERKLTEIELLGDEQA